MAGGSGSPSSNSAAIIIVSLCIRAREFEHTILVNIPVDQRFVCIDRHAEIFPGFQRTVPLYPDSGVTEVPKLVAQR